MQTPIAASMRFAVVGDALCKLGATLMLTPLAHHFYFYKLPAGETRLFDALHKQRTTLLCFAV